MKKYLSILMLFVIALAAGCTDKSNTGGTSTKDIPADEIVDKIVESCELPNLAKITDNDFAKDYFKLDLENPKYNEISIWQCPMSAQLAEIIIIKTADTEAAKADLQARKEKLINVDTFYPDQQNIAGNAIIGNAGDYVYFIAADAAESAETALKDAITE